MKKKPSKAKDTARCLQCGGRLSLATGRFCVGCLRAMREDYFGS